MRLSSIRTRLLRIEKRQAQVYRPPSTAAPPIEKLQDWAHHYLSGYFKLPPSSFHQWLVGQLQNLHSRRGSRLALVAPRGSAKSTWVSLVYPLWAALSRHELYIQIISDTQSQARLLLEAIKRELEDNPLLASGYPWAVGKGSPWGQDRIRLVNGVVIEALGTGAKIRGRRNRAERPSLIIVDDPQNDQHVTSAIQRERSWNWFNRAVANAGTPETNVLVLGTALHRNCLVLRLAQTGGWEGKTFRAIEKMPERMDLWSTWERIYLDWEDPEHEKHAAEYYKEHRQEMSAGVELLWPEREDLYGLMCLRSTIGAAAFASEKQGDPFDPAACEFLPEYFGGPGFWFDEWPESLWVRTLALDPSKGKDADVGDYSALVKLGIDKHRIMYVEADLRRRPTPQVVADSVEMVRQFRPEVFGVEVNQFQELLVADLQRVGAEQNVLLPIFPMLNDVDKKVRIRRLGSHLAQRKFRFKSRSPGTALLVQQLQDFPVGDHDDGPDALEMALRLMIDQWNGRFARPQPGGRLIV
jgi:predicted phage terminase large subunit-like protein